MLAGPVNHSSPVQNPVQFPLGRAVKALESSLVGADVNAANDHGITALHGAGYKGANKAVQLLVDRGAKLDVLDKGEDYGFGVSTTRMTPLNWAEGVPIGMSSAIYHTDTVELMSKLMRERGIPVVLHSFQGEKGANYNFGQPDAK
jgi:ankyrin repeat protein